MPYVDLSVLDNAVVAEIGNPEKAVFVTGNSSAMTELVGEGVDKGVVWAKDPETIAATVLTDGNVALSINGDS